MVADTGSSIFNKKATEKLRSPDDLDKYVRMTNPSVWVVLTACIFLLAGLLAWAVFGTVSTGVKATGTCVDGSVMCFLPGEKAMEVHEGDAASVEGRMMTVGSISSVPVSREEAGKIVSGDYLISALLEGDWAYVVSFKGDASGFDEKVPLAINITTEQIAPITLLWGGTQ